MNEYEDRNGKKSITLKSNSLAKSELNFEDEEEYDVVANYIDKLCLKYKSALKKISKLKKENTKLREQNLSKE